MSSLFVELKRRNVFRVGAAYLALGWIVTQVTATIGPAMNLPATLTPIVVWIGVIAFPFVLLFSWAYELTPEGLKREHEVERTESITHQTAKKLDTVVIVLLVVAIGLFVFDRFSPRGDRKTEDSRAEARPTSTTNGDALVGRPSGRHEPDTGSTNADPLVGRPSGRQEPTAVPAPPTDNSIAVLPFVNMSSDKEQDYFSDGLSEELLNLLAQVEGLRVIARTSSFSFKGKDLDIATIAKQLNVANVLEGSVRRAGNTLRVTAQLVRASDSSHLWSKSFDREMADVFKVQDEIAGEVVGALKLKLLPGSDSPGAKTANTEAYNKYLLGKQFNQRNTPDGWRQAVIANKEAIALDPDYAAAWAGLAIGEMYSADYQPTLPDINAAKQRAREAADRAVQLDPRLPEAYAARVLVRSGIDWDWDGAQADIERFLALAPGNARAHNQYAGMLAGIGRIDEAVAEGRKAVELDPLSSLAWSNLSGSLWISGDRTGAREAARRAVAINPESDFALNSLAYVELLDGNPEAALETFAKTSSLWNRIGSAMAEHSLGHAEASQRLLEDLEANNAESGAYQIAEVHAWRGDKDKALEWLERALAQRDGGLANITTDPILAPLKDEPRFAAVVQQVGLPLPGAQRAAN